MNANNVFIKVKMNANKCFFSKENNFLGGKREKEGRREERNCGFLSRLIILFQIKKISGIVKECIFSFNVVN